MKGTSLIILVFLQILQNYLVLSQEQSNDDAYNPTTRQIELTAEQIDKMLERPIYRLIGSEKSMSLGLANGGKISSGVIPRPRLLGLGRLFGLRGGGDLSVTLGVGQKTALSEPQAVAPPAAPPVQQQPYQQQPYQQPPYQQQPYQQQPFQQQPFQQQPFQQQPQPPHPFLQQPYQQQPPQQPPQQHPFLQQPYQQQPYNNMQMPPQVPNQLQQAQSQPRPNYVPPTVSMMPRGPGAPSDNPVDERNTNYVTKFLAGVADYIPIK